MKWFLLLLLLLSFTSCNEEKLKITRAGEFRFRRSYAGIQFRNVNDSTIDSILNSNPSPVYADMTKKDSLFQKKLQELGILDSSFSLVRSQFPDAVAKQFALTGNNGKTVQGAFIRTADGEPGHYQLVISDKTRKAVFNLEENYGALNRDISYFLLDLIPGGFPEIVILNEYYIMNGDNSDIYIYEITE